MFTLWDLSGRNIILRARTLTNYLITKIVQLLPYGRKVFSQQKCYLYLGLGRYKYAFRVVVELFHRDSFNTSYVDVEDPVNEKSSQGHK